MPGDVMMSEDGEVYVGADWYELVSDDAYGCAECCDEPGDCELPAPMTVCAAYDLFNLAPAPGDGARRQVLLPLPGGAPTTMTVQLRAEIEWGTRGGPEFGDILTYTLKTEGLQNPVASEIVSLRPVVQQDAGGCWRIVEWRGPAVLWYDQVINTSGGVSTSEVGVCVHLTMTAGGWQMAIDIVGTAKTGTFVFRRPGGGAGDAKGGFGDALHQSTFEGLGQQRVPLATQVVAGRGTNMTAGLGDYLEPPAGVSPRGCPPYLGPLSVRASPGTKCTPGQVTAPGRFRMKWHAEYDYSQSGSLGVVTHEVQDFVIEFRDPYTPPEDWRTVTVNQWTVKGMYTSGNQPIDEAGTFAYNTLSALGVLGLMVVENRAMKIFPTHVIDFGGLTLGSGCKQRIEGTTSVEEWNGKDTLTSRRLEYTYTDGGEISINAKAVLTWTLEAIDVLTCSGPGALMAMPPVRTLEESAAIVGRMLRGEM